MSEKINLKARSEAYKDAKSAVEKGGPEAVGAARRMINEEKIGQSEEFEETARADMEAFDKKQKALSEQIEVARTSRNREEVARLEKLYDQNDAEYHGNPETAGAKLEKEPKFVVLDNAKLKEIFGETLIGKPASEVMRLVKEKYGDKVPGLEHREYLISNPDKVPKQMQDGSYYYFLRGLSASGGVPCAFWNNNMLYRNANSPRDEWDGDDRVLLLV
ncbi:hypothetical protein A3I95_01055 [Candidatus Nomurabacteria bacterium RIFCSPLOWO2_02_FULL_44_12]|nr:MAG: hypothetical protein A3I95_01055 [Candidatus Nomurabacteria bacterium RIFCSPLOWO2_02_FULL_44_12]